MACKVERFTVKVLVEVQSRTAVRPGDHRVVRALIAHPRRLDQAARQAR
jgi:hypothetical protein